MTQQPVHHSTKRRIDLVKAAGVLKEQVFIEEKTNKRWNDRWGFVKDVDKVCLHLAKEKGIDEEEYKRRTKKLECHKEEFHTYYKPTVVESFPKLSSGYVGWRSAKKECNLEFLGPLYISPRHTIEPPDQKPPLPIMKIYLG